jgi:hypothetical protein
VEIPSGVVVNEDPRARPSRRPTAQQREQLRILAPLLRSERTLIDVGCSNGSFLRHAVDGAGAGATSYGVEVSEPNAAAARRAGVRVESTLQDVPRDSVVTFWHSAEHLPIALLVDLVDQVRERSNATATILICVPNGASAQYRVLGDRWTYYDPQAHVSQFTPDSLRILMRRADWEPIMRFSTPVYGAFGAVQSSVNLLRPHNELYEYLKRRSVRLGPRAMAANGAAAVLTLPVAAALALAETSRRRAAVLTSAFRVR